MKSRVSAKFEMFQEKRQKPLITYITAGDPDLRTTHQLVLEMERAGADIIELGIPYSDPLADGPVIQRASQRALQAGCNIDEVFQLVENIRKDTEIPLVFLAYFNSVYKYGFERFLNHCQDKGIDGLIIPDLPLEERSELQEKMRDYPIDLIPLVAPTSEERIKEIVTDATGFIYCVSSMGVTGKREKFEVDLNRFIGQVKKYTSVPAVLGFGISSPKMIKELKYLCDGLIVGSAVIEKIEEGLADGTAREKVYEFIKELSEAKI
ncbi:tryptophan synthase subunit alpha [Anaerosolibacter sp.]|uniref:tryptophan synthase subunit alpha n=1 Tax=Anaerosolibacter sp. TaxID=1872527 RepID=UPI0039EFDC36